MPKINFTKMHGLGNDFIVLNGIEDPISISSLSIPKLSHRHIGIGFDQLILIEKSEQGIACRFFNADGSEAEQCGNGIRCAARYAFENHLIDAKNFSIETKAGIIPVTIHSFNEIEATLGVPKFIEDASVLIQQKNYDLSILSMGNPHAIISTSSVKTLSLDIGKALSTHPIFPEGANIGFMEILDPTHICLRTYERGVGETLACGSNACAAVAAGIKKFGLEKKVEVELALGSIQIVWENLNGPIKMIGPAEVVFVGSVDAS